MATKPLIWIGLIAVLLSACGTVRPFGASFESAKYNQILNPDARKNLKPATGFDGHAAELTLKKYREDFERPAPEPVYTFSLSPIGGR